MLPINVMYDSGLSELEEVAVLTALQEVSLAVQIPDITCYGSEPWSLGAYSSADWYIQNTQVVRANQGGTQLNADHLVDLVNSEPWQESPHIDIVITSRDITAFDAGHQLNFVFGLASGRVSVQSIARFRDLDILSRFLAVKAVIWHELGHILGMAAATDRPHTEYKLGPHCTNPGCVMRQGMSVPEWVEHAEEAFQSGQIFCHQCLEDAYSAVL